MSRAFVDDDSAQAGVQDLPEIPLPLPPGARNYLTPEGAAALASELAFLLRGERPRLAGALARAATGAAGEAEALRRSLAELDRRASYLGRMSALAEVVGPPSGPPGRVVFGATARVRGADGRERAWRIVGVDESDPERGLVGWSSPLARALVGRRAGETALVRLPEGEEHLEILGVEYPEADAGLP